MSNKKRYAIVMVISVLLNEIGSNLAGLFHLPVWLDTAGTALAAIVLEPAAGLIVGLVDNFLLSVIYFNASSMVYYSLSAAVALVAGVGLKKQGRIDKKRILPCLLLAMLLTGALSGSLTLWHGGISSSVVERGYYDIWLTRGFHPAASCYLAAFQMKIGDTLACAALLTVVYRLLPKKLRFDMSLKNGE